MTNCYWQIKLIIQLIINIIWHSKLTSRVSGVSRSGAMQQTPNKEDSYIIKGISDCPIISVIILTFEVVLVLIYFRQSIEQCQRWISNNVKIKMLKWMIAKLFGQVSHSTV